MSRSVLGRAPSPLRVAGEQPEVRVLGPRPLHQTLVMTVREIKLGVQGEQVGVVKGRRQPSTQRVGGVRRKDQLRTSLRLRDEL
jgi:hypothetical protein